jgi:hypothetical protein
MDIGTPPVRHKLFPSQMDDEPVYLVVREHWIRLLGKLLLWTFFAAALIVFNRYVKASLPLLFEGRIGLITQLFTQVYTLFLAASLFLIWLIYYLNVQIITDRRIVDIDQVGLFSHTTTELHIENIEDVTSQNNGILGNIFNYGMVYVQTAGSKERFEFNNVASPGLIEKTLLDLYEKLPHHERVHKG